MTTTTADFPRRWPKVTVLVAAVLALLVWWAVPASAHVEAAGSAGVNGATQVTFSFSHGCSGSPTTGLRIQLPDGTTNVQPDSHDGFNSNASNTELSWSGGNVPDSQPAEFTATMVLLGNQGDTVFFPTIQSCVSGEEAWIEKTSDPEADNAAPRIQLPVNGPTTTTTAEATTTTAAPTTTTSTTAASTTTTSTSTTTTTTRPGTTVPPATSSDSGNPWPWIIVIIVAVVGATIIGVLLYQRAQANKAAKDGEQPGNGEPPTEGTPPTGGLPPTGGVPPTGADPSSAAPAGPPATDAPGAGPSGPVQPDAPTQVLPPDQPGPGQV